MKSSKTPLNKNKNTTLPNPLLLKDEDGILFTTQLFRQSQITSILTPK